MNESKFKVVGVNYVGDNYKEAWSSDIYYYKISSSIDVKVDDRVYIKNQLKENLARVAEIVEDSEDDLFKDSYKTPQRFLVLDLSQFLEVEAKYDRIREIESIMDKKVKQIEKLQKYEILKDLDPSVGEILDELKQLKLETSNNILIEAPKEEN